MTFTRLQIRADIWLSSGRTLTSGDILTCKHGRASTDVQARIVVGSPASSYTLRICSSLSCVNEYGDEVDTCARLVFAH